jgi:hypothetical protein
MTGIAGFRRWSAMVPGLIAGAGFASPVFAATGGLGSEWSALLQTDGATLLLYGSIGLLGLALALKFAVWAEERRNYRPQFFPTDRQIPIEPTPH